MAVLISNLERLGLLGYRHPLLDPDDERDDDEEFDEDFDEDAWVVTTDFGAAFLAACRKPSTKQS
jgi:hypothetical protein